jgi:hypothetical protein
MLELEVTAKGEPIYNPIFEVDLGRSSIDSDQYEKYHASSPE